MSSYEYSQVGVPSSSPSSAGGGGANKNKDETKRALSRLLQVAPFYHFFVDPLLRVIPSCLLSALLRGATGWRRLMGARPLKAVHGVLNDITVAHLLLSLPLVWWFVRATDVALLRPTAHHSLKESGKMASYCMMGAFLTSHKSHSFVSLVTGLSFDRLIPFHLASALLTLWMCLLHGVQIAYWHRGDKTASHHDDHDEHHHHDDEEEDGDHDHDEEEHHHHDDTGHRMLHHHDSIHSYLGPDPNLWKFLVDGEMNISGFAVLVSLMVVVATSVFHGVFRRVWFEGWLVSHITGACVILVAGLIHGADVFLFAIIWWALDLVIRYGIMLGAVRYPKQATVTRVAENVTKLEWPKASSDHFQYEAGQFVQISIPSVKLWEFHPFSIASAPEDPTVTLYVRALPNPKTWTRQLYKLAEPRDENKISTSSVRIFLEGPYGSVPSIIENPRHQYSMAVFISGGIGVTPCHSIARSLLLSYNQQPALQKLRYIWSVRNEDIITAIPPPTMGESSASGNNTNGFAGLNGGGKGGSYSDDDAENGIELVERSADDDSVASEESPDMLNQEARPPLEVQTDIYVTQMNKFLDSYDDEEVEKSVETTKEAEDAGAPYKIHRGRRPDVHAILNQVQAEAAKNGWGKVFVMGCGPISLLEDLSVACQRTETKQVQIDFHQEIFDY